MSDVCVMHLVHLQLSHLITVFVASEQMSISRRMAIT